MELSEAEKHAIKQVLSHADGEDMEEIVRATGFEEYLLHSLIMRATDDELEYFLAERKDYRTNVFK